MMMSNLPLDSDHVIVPDFPYKAQILHEIACFRASWSRVCTHRSQSLCQEGKN